MQTIPVIKRNRAFLITMGVLLVVSLFFVLFTTPRYLSYAKSDYAGAILDLMHYFAGLPIFYISLLSLLIEILLVWDNTAIPVGLKRLCWILATLMLVLYVILIVLYILNMFGGLSILSWINIPLYFSMCGILLAIGTYRHVY